MTSFNCGKLSDFSFILTIRNQKNHYDKTQKNY